MIPHRSRIPGPLAALAALVLAVALWLLPVAAAAQRLDYGALLETLGLASEEPAPAMSRIPQPAPGPASGPASAAAPVAAPVAVAPAYAGPPALGAPDGRAAEVDAYGRLAAASRAPEVEAYGRIAAERQAAENMIVRTTDNVAAFRSRVRLMLRAAPDLPGDLAAALRRNSPDGGARHFLGVVALVVIAGLIGRAMVSLFAVLIARPMMLAAQRGPAPQTLGDKLPVLALRFGLTVAAAGILTGVAAAICFAILPDHRPTALTASILLVTWGGFMLIDTAWRMTVCPYLPDYRIPRLEDDAARRLYLWLSAVTALSLSAGGLAAWVEALGIDGPSYALVVTGASLLALLAALATIWVNRRAVSAAILGGRPSEEASWFAAICALLWAPAAALYLLAAWSESLVRTVLGDDPKVQLLLGAYLTLMAALVIYAGAVFAVEKLFARARMRRAPPAPPPAAPPVEAARMDGDGDADGDGDEEGGPAVFTPPAAARREARIETLRSPLFPTMNVRRRRMETYEDLAERTAALIALGVAAWMLARLWGGAEIFAEGTPLGLAQNVVDTGLIGYVIYHAVRIWLDQRIAEERGEEVELEPGDEGGASSTSRLGTLLPLFRAAVLFVILSGTALSLAMEMGVNVAPLFAGAGVVGLAIGFGAQTLVRDILSGVFFLLDDAFRKGEYIDVGEVKGTVEKISIRSFQLRHHLGALHTIPFGEITRLTNFSRDWVMMKLPLRLTYDTDVERVRKLVKKLGQQLLEHPVEGPKFLQPLKSQGVIQMEDSAMIVRVKFMTRPGDQWTTRKLVYQEIRSLFAREGIKFAHREVTVRLPDLPEDRPLTPHQREAVAAATERAMEDEDRRDGGEDPALMR